MKLTKNPIELLELSLKDMRTVISQGHKINMHSWGEVIDKNTCSVCMAGAVMMNTLGHKVNEVFNPMNSSMEEYYPQLHALDCIRVGSLEAFLKKLGAKIIIKNNFYKIPKEIIGWKCFNKHNPEEFFNQIQELIDFLKTQEIKQDQLYEKTNRS